MHEIGTHVIDIQISTIIYSNDIKITWNQVTISLCALGSTSRLAQQSETLPMMSSQHKTHLHWPRPRLSEQLNTNIHKRSTLHGSYSEMKAISWAFPRFEFRSLECLFHALDCSMRLLGEIGLPLFHGMAYSVALFSGTERLKCLDISSKSLSNTIQNEPAVSCSR